MIRLEGVCRTFARAGSDPVHALQDVSLEVRRGETLALLGPSGCGKTTMLRLMNRLLDPTAGRILLDDRDLSSLDPIRLRRRMGYVVQNAGIFPHLTVRRNVALLCEVEGWSTDRRRQRVDELLELVKLPPPKFAHRYPSELSGGQNQRVGIARALALDPEILLMDEPFGALDPITRRGLQAEFLELESKVEKTVVLITHDLEEAFLLGDRVALLHEGRMVQVGTPEEIKTSPASAWVGKFVAGQTERRKGW